jgi:hypothetical protein
MRRKVLSMLLAVVMVCGLLPMTAIASPDKNSPTTVRAGETITQNVGTTSAEGKYYLVTLPYDGFFHFNVTVDQGGESLQDFYLLDRSGNSMGENFVTRGMWDSSFSPTFPKHLDAEPLSAGEYIIFANSWVSFARGSGSFTFSYTTTPATPEPTPEPTPTPPPTSGDLGGYKSESVNLVGIRLEWSPVSGGVGYRVYRSEVKGELGIPATDFYTIGHDFIDVNIKPNTTYYYTVRQRLREATVSGTPEQFGAESNQVEVRSPGTILGDNLTRPNASAVKKVIVMKIDDPMMTIANGSRQEIDPGRGTVPLIRNSRTLVPIRAIVESMGGTVGYNDSTREISLRYGQQNVSMWPDNQNITVNGASKTVDVAPAVINARTMVPIRFAGENLGCAVEFINSTRQVVIVYY